MNDRPLIVREGQLRQNRPVAAQGRNQQPHQPQDLDRWHGMRIAGSVVFTGLYLGLALTDLYAEDKLNGYKSLVKAVFFGALTVIAVRMALNDR